jgi:hypothetical protein
MKSLQKKYKKEPIQVLNCEFEICEDNKLFYSFLEKKHNTLYNLIGFWREIYDPIDKRYKDNFYSYSHHVDEDNYKLFKKYPYAVLRKYKE